MLKTTFYRLLLFSFLLPTLVSANLNAQSTDTVDAYEEYSEAPREIAYAHLNKSTYIEGEMLGFTAYVFDKFTKKPSKMTSNLYCTISDEEGKVIKKKLVRVNKGVASNVFDVDSTLSTGIFTFKAYTNWMRNFEEQNHFEQTFKVIDADNLGEVKPVSPKDIQIDLQALGEGGHIIYNVSNTIGIIAKNQFGYGIANAYGSIKDDSGNIVSEFQLNDVGLAKTLLTPIPGKRYSANININEQEVSSQTLNIESYGIAMSLSSTSDIIRLQVKTNTETLQRNKNRDYKVALHNGSDMVLSPFQLNENGTVVLSFPKSELSRGVNIFTIFSNDEKPLLERLYFNNSSILQNKISKVKVKPETDSLSINLDLDLTETLKSSHLSVSILPSETKSYNHHHNILTQLFIQPYIKGRIENGSSYFKSNDRKTQYNLDLLMLTQGWSSYNWKTILNNQERTFLYPFERGIDIVANVNKEKPGTYIVYPLAGNKTKIFDVPQNEEVFTIKKSFPTNDDLFRIGYVNTKKKKFKEKPSLYLQYYPSKFPEFKNELNVIDETYTLNETSVNPNQEINTEKEDNVTKLDEVLIKAESRKTRLETLQTKATNARIDLIADNIKLRNLRLDLYLQRLGWVTQFDYFSGTLSITNPRVKWGNPVPLVYLDNALLSGLGVNSDFSLLTFLNMGDIDYIEYEFYGVGGGIRGNAGFIKIFSDPNGTTIKKNNKVTTYDVPLRFSKEKTFYTPKYKYYNSDFFIEYGTIGWHPNVKLDATGTANFKFYDTKTKDISLFVEGILNDNEYISQEIKIEREN
ncbi:hypothetical protein [uncultured Winogradskyella sp.]|uniref:hypothetical protein n=1 Tax=uncultured Winogradskyella sp. TaxID=395353 RepID=UPI002637401B|nr:hypothetical protein [uncultured Winogradskyella sp.]